MRSAGRSLPTPELDNYNIIITVKHFSQLFIRYFIVVSGHVIIVIELIITNVSYDVTILKVCRVNWSYAYFLKNILVKNERPIYDYVR